MKKIYQWFVGSIIMLAFSAHGFGQVSNDLNQKVSIEASNVTIAEVLINIGEQARIKFSYNPKLIKSKKRVNVSASRREVREVLNGIFKEKFDYKLRGSYVIIVDKKASSESLSKAKKTILLGSVIDKETKDGIQNVSIYTSAGANAVTDATGAFRITLNKDENSQLALRRKDYYPLSYETNHVSSSELEIGMEAIQSISVTVHRDSISTERLGASHIAVATMYPINTELQANQNNIKDSIDKPVSFSLYPGLATYGNLSGNIKFKFALNFIGYNRGIEGAELSLFSSINRDDVSGVQLAGLSNHVGKEFTGYQSAGIFNKVGGDFRGVQMSGITNVNFKNLVGVQHAGINNHVKGEVKGLQMAGIFNKSAKVKGAQIGGISNVSDTIQGLQMAGLGNHVKHANGLQLSGLYNYADTISGGQVSGLVNIGGVVKGSQIGILNVADSISGFPIGLFNFIKNGYKRIGVHIDELFPINVEFRSGVDRFYTILRAGSKSDFVSQDSSFFTYGAGIGSGLKLANNLSLEIEATANQIVKRNNADNLSLNIKGYLGLEFRLGKRLSIASGMTYNTYLFERELLEDLDFNTLRDSYIVDTSNDMDKNVWRSWLGYRVGVRFVL